MKNLISILLFSITVCCNTCNIGQFPVDKNDSLSLTESNIINDFLETELTSDRYKNYKNYQYVLIQEALMKKMTLDSYLYSYEREFLINGKNLIKEIDKKIYILDSVNIKNVKNDLENESIFYWKNTDLKKVVVNIQKQADFLKTMKTDEFLYLPHRLIIFLSRPLIVDDSNALVSFDIGNGDFGNIAITHFTVLMRKVDGKWVQSAYYEDGVFY